MLPDTILGISLGTCRLGLAVGNNTGLIHWQIKGFDETYSKKKAKKIWRAIEQTVLRYGITVIGMKIPPKSCRSDGLAHCLKYITQRALEKEIILFFYDIEAIEQHFVKAEAKNKAKVAECIADKYPQLKREFFKLEKCQYHMKIFEAVASMDLASLETF